MRQAHRLHLTTENMHGAGFHAIGNEDERDQLIVADAVEFEFAVFVRRHRRDEFLQLASGESPDDARGVDCPINPLRP